MLINMRPIKLSDVICCNEKCAGSKMSYLHTIKTTYTFANKSDVSWFGRVKDVVKYCVFTSVNAPVNLPQATLHGQLHIGVWQSAVQLTPSEHSVVLMDITTMRSSLQTLLTLDTCYHDTWFPVTTARRVLKGCRWRNILNKSRTADQGWSSGLGLGRGANNSLTVKTGLVTKQMHGGHVLLLHTNRAAAIFISRSLLLQQIKG
jgi:hypothetical protein